MTLPYSYRTQARLALGAISIVIAQRGRWFYWTPDYLQGGLHFDSHHNTDADRQFDLRLFEFYGCSYRFHLSGDNMYEGCRYLGSCGSKKVEVGTVTSRALDRVRERALGLLCHSITQIPARQALLRGVLDLPPVCP